MAVRLYVDGELVLGALQTSENRKSSTIKLANKKLLKDVAPKDVYITMETHAAGAYMRNVERGEGAPPGLRAQQDPEHARGVARQSP